MPSEHNFALFLLYIMKKITLLTLIVWGLGFAQMVVAKTPEPAIPPQDSVLSVVETQVADLLIDSVRGETTRTVAAAVDLEGIDSIGTYHTPWQVTREATYNTITTRRTYLPVEVPIPPVSDSIRTGHYLQGALGLGGGTMGYSFRSEDARQKGGFDGTLQLQYAYFFHQNWGVSIGLGASTYGGSVLWSGSRTWLDQTDSDGERYDHTAAAENWTERQRTWLLDIPVALQYQKLFNPRIGMYGAVGLNIGFPLSTQSSLREGSLTHTGYYDRWHMSVHDWRDFYTEEVGREFSRDPHKTRLSPVQAAIRADLGLLFPVENQWDVLIGAYFRYTLNNMLPAHDEEVAWMHTGYEGAEAYRNHDFMEHEYGSIIETREVEKMHPWQVGIKLGVQWHYVDHRTHYCTEFEPTLVYDTVVDVRRRTYEVETLEYDTVMTPYQEIRRLMNKAIIWFDLNSYEPKLDPVDILDQMAAVLIAHPELRCKVNGHTCTIGRRAYNQKLSEKRAKAVADRLVALGVKPEQLECHGFCSDVPYFSESHQLFLDRRCEIIPIEETNEQHIVHQVIKGKKK